MKILVNLPNGLQEVIEVGSGGDYSDQSAIVWHEGRDGPMPSVTTGKMQRQGNALVELPDYLPTHTAALAAKQAETEKELRLDSLSTELKSDTTVSQLRAMTGAELDTWLDANATTLPEIRNLLKIIAKILIVNNGG